MNTINVEATRDRVEAFRRKHRTGLLTLVFTDIIGSTKLKQSLGDRAAVALIQEHHEAVREILTRFNEGEEIATAGDSFFIVFTKPSDAVRFSLFIQARLRLLAAKTGHSILDRIGIHVGEVWIEERPDARKPKDLYGIQVDSCARVASLGGADQILMTRFPFDSARQVLKNEDLDEIGTLSWLNHGPYSLKGVEEPTEVCEVGEVGWAALIPPANSDKAHRFLSADAEPVLGWRPAIDQQVPGTSWVLEEKLGEGGFGEVWLGRDKALKTPHVFKFCFRADRVRALKREVTLFRLLQQRIADHPNIVAVEATYFDEAPFYVVMQHIDGSDLPRWCQQHGEIPLIPLSTRLEIVAQVADALQAAHDSGIIHRDVKPSNILVSGSATEVHAFLTDFGIGQVVSEEVLRGISRMGFTQTLADSASNAGTQLYMAPELLAGKPASTRSDIYALGMVLYQVIIGDFSRPFTGDWARHISNPLLREDLEKCFAGDPNERFAGASELANRVRSLETRMQTLARQGAIIKARETAAYRRGILRAAGIATLIVLLFVGLALYSFQQARRADLNAEAARLSAQTTRATLSRSDFFQALRSINEDNDWDGLSQLARSVSLYPDNQAALCRLTALLTYRNYPTPVCRLRHDGVVTTAQFSPDGKRIVTASADKTARIWDAETGKTLTEPLKHDDYVHTAQLSPDGKRIVTASGDRTARIWDAETGNAVTEPMKHDSDVYTAQFSPDGKRIVTASGDGTARIWDAETGKALTEPLTHDGVVTTAQFSPDGKRIVTASNDRTARIWDAETGKALTEPLKHDDVVLTAQFSPEGKRIVTASFDKTSRIWDAETGEALTEPLKHDGVVTTAQFSPDGKRIVTASGDKTARIWDAETGEALTEPMKHDAVVTTAQFSPDGKRIVTASWDKTARIWNAETGKALTEPMKHDGAVTTAQFSPEGKRIVTASFDKTARIWDAETGEALTEPMKHDNYVRTAQFSPDGKRVTASDDTTARIWDAETGKALTEPLKHGFVRIAQFSPDGKRIVTASGDKTARIWDAETGKALTEPLKHDNYVTTAQFSPDAKRIVTASGNKTARIWDAETGKALTEPLKHDGVVTTAQFSPDGKRIVTASEDRTARTWDLMPTGKDWPEWLPRLADAIAGQHLNDRGFFESLNKDPADALKEIKDQLSRESAENDWVIWGRWFLADRSTRTISPFSKITVPEYIQNRIKERTAASLDEAEALAFGDSEIMKQISIARAALRN
jgi:WD40 repeat protein/class 3 adenylate cyclase/tRNA A-37 threonylcarbamoyl transferase component Bud32